MAIGIKESWMNYMTRKTKRGKESRWLDETERLVFWNIEQGGFEVLENWWALCVCVTKCICGYKMSI